MSSLWTSVVPSMLIIIPCSILAFSLPWMTVQYRVHTVEKKDVVAGATVNATSVATPLTTKQVSVQLRLRRCLGGICGAQQEEILDFLLFDKNDEDPVPRNGTDDDRAPMPALPQEERDFLTPAFDSLASFLRKILIVKRSNADHNMRNDPQVTPFFRAAIASSTCLCAAVGSALLAIFFHSVTFHFYYFLGADTTRNPVTLVADEIGSTLSLISAALAAAGPLMYLLMTFHPVHLLSEHDAEYKAGFFVTLSLTTTILLLCLIIDCCASKSGKSRPPATSLPSVTVEEEPIV